MVKNFYKTIINNITVIKSTLKLPTIIAAGCSAIISTSVFANNQMFKPSVGIDVGIRSMQFQKLYGDGHFANHYNYISPYVKANVWEHLGIQAGIETSDTRRVRKNYGGNDILLGVDTNGVETKFYSSSRVNGGFIGLYINSNTFWQEYIPTKLSLFAGISLLKCRMSHDEVFIHPQDTNEILDSGTKSIPKLSITGDFSITKIPGLSFTVSYGFEKTSNLAVQKISYLDIPAPGKILLIKLKNSYYSCVGISYQL